MDDKKVLLDAAALLVKLATGDKPIDPKLAEILAVWEKLQEQFKNDEKPHEWRDWTSGMLPGQSGTNEPESPFYEKFKGFWKAMEREKRKDHKGEVFVYQNCIKRGGNADFEEAVKFMAAQPYGKAWFNDSANAYILPKPADLLLLL